MASLARVARTVASTSPSRLTALNTARAFSTSPTVQEDVENVTVFGAGLMGAGIAQVLAHKGGYNVTLSDVTDKALANGQNIISKSLTRIAKKSMADASADEQSKFVKGVVDSIKYSTDAKGSVKDTDLVIEAIVENIDIKRQLFELLDKEAPQEALFASNTSSLAIKDIAAATKRLDRFGGFHAFNPVPQMKLVEIIRTNETSQDTFDSLMSVAKKMGKVPVACVD
ncbi:nad binding 3-hydroxyacyl-CoA dehydrogenase, partial [Tilletiaria anomala UBC 951]